MRDGAIWRLGDLIVDGDGGLFAMSDAKNTDIFVASYTGICPMVYYIRERPPRYGVGSIARGATYHDCTSNAAVLG